MAIFCRYHLQRTYVSLKVCNLVNVLISIMQRQRVLIDLKVKTFAYREQRSVDGKRAASPQDM